MHWELLHVSVHLLTLSLSLSPSASSCVLSSSPPAVLCPPFFFLTGAFAPWRKPADRAAAAERVLEAVHDKLQQGPLLLSELGVLLRQEHKQLFRPLQKLGGLQMVLHACQLFSRWPRITRPHPHARWKRYTASASTTSCGSAASKCSRCSACGSNRSTYCRGCAQCCSGRSPAASSFRGGQALAGACAAIGGS